MPAVIIADPGAVNANSFGTLAEAETYHQTVVDSAAWDDADPDVKVRALISATRDLTFLVRWYGRAATETQALPFPRIWLRTREGFYIPSDVIPQEVKNAEFELARLKIAAGGAVATAADNSLKSLKAGPVNLVFNNDAAPVSEGIPDQVFRMIAHLAESSSGSGGVRTAPLVRT